MSNYNESPVAGTKWLRCSRVVIENRYGVQPRVELVEEMAMSDGNDVLVKPLGRLSIDFDPLAVIDLVDPATGLPTGQSMTHGDIYVALHSLYLQLATERDAQG